MTVDELLLRSVENVSVIYFLISLTFYLTDKGEPLSTYSAWWKRILFGGIFGMIAELLMYTTIVVEGSALTYNFCLF